MEKLDLEYMPHMAMLPLGTGNDLAKVMHWGRYFDKLHNFDVRRFVKKVFTVRRACVRTYVRTRTYLEFCVVTFATQPHTAPHV